MKADCPNCNGTGIVTDPDDSHQFMTCIDCDGAGVIEGTQDELFSVLRWAPVWIVLLVLQCLLR